ncbi:hypothetical protein NDU88_003972 [Pleurodeles waltl]|uniref:Uncharacterized protein n=1 Tax=Pleurodeles waltl TaxID=8319 RepID=A0AAV7WWT5_PLEWA|nr:hypothetical protein NDU88_003972 [Pleurodeles waltl]
MESSHGGHRSPERQAQERVEPQAPSSGSVWSVSSPSEDSVWMSLDYDEDDLGFPTGASSRGKYILKENLEPVVSYLSSTLQLPVDSAQPYTRGKPSLLSEEVTLSDPVDEKVEAALKRSHAGLSLSLRSEIYGVYTSQSRVKYFQSLSSAVQEGADLYDLLSCMEVQAKFLSDIAFDPLKASAMAIAGSVSAHRHLHLRAGGLIPPRRIVYWRMPFGGSKVFGDELEEVLRKSFKCQKHVQPFRPRPKMAWSQDPVKRSTLADGITFLVLKGALRSVPPQEMGYGCYFRVFMVRKVTGDFRLIIDLNLFDPTFLFWMSTLHQVCPTLSVSSVPPAVSVRFCERVAVSSRSDAVRKETRVSWIGPVSSVFMRMSLKQNTERTVSAVRKIGDLRELSWIGPVSSVFMRMSLKQNTERTISGIILLIK